MTQQFRVRLHTASDPGIKHNSFYLSDDSDTVSKSAALKQSGAAGKLRMESVADHANRTWSLKPDQSFIVVRSAR